MKKALILILVLIAVFFVELVVLDDNTDKHAEEPYISVTSFALYDIAKHIVAEKVKVNKLVPFGVETHTYMPSVKTMSELSKSQFFVSNGMGLEPWLKKVYPNQMDMSQFVTLREIKHDKDEDEDHHHDTEGLDPHYWLDIDNMIKMTEALLLKLEEFFPKYKDDFNVNAHAYIEELRVLDEEFKKGLSHCEQREIVVNHNAFGYLGARYDFSTHSVTGLSPDEQVSAKKMREITDLVREENIPVIFFESFVSAKVSETISKETGAKVESLQPLANVSKAEANSSYIEVMRKNLEKLKDAMRCR